MTPKPPPRPPVRVLGRATLMVLVGTPAMAALLGGALAWSFEVWRLAVPISGSDRLGAALFGGLSAIALALLVRGSVRAWRGASSPSPMLTAVVRVAPVTMRVGLVAGGVLASRIVGNHHRNLEAGAVTDCAIALEAVDAADPGAACVQAALNCGRLRVENPTALPQPSMEALKMMPERFRARSGLFRREAYCLLQAVGGEQQAADNR